LSSSASYGLTPVTYPDADSHEKGLYVRTAEGVLPVWKHSTPLFSHTPGVGVK